MKTYQILFYHGFNVRLYEKITSTISMEENNNSLMYTGSLDNFVELYKAPILVSGNNIYITQHSSFGQR